MFRPQIQKTRVLVAMAFFGLSMVYWASNSTVIHTAVGYEEKILASEIMESALKVLKKEVKGRDFTIYRDIDPNTTGLIFKEDSPIRSSSGDLEAMAGRDRKLNGMAACCGSAQQRRPKPFPHEEVHFG